MCKYDEAPGVGLYHLINYALQLVSPHTGENDDGSDVQFVHSLEQFCRRDTVFDAHGIVHVLVHVDHRKARALHFMRGRMQHGLRLEIAQQKGLFLFGILGRLIADLLRKEISGNRKRHRDCDKTTRPFCFFAHQAGLKGKLQSKLHQPRITRRLRKSESTV